jgi:hypothetical protein
LAGLSAWPDVVDAIVAPGLIQLCDIDPNMSSQVSAADGKLATTAPTTLAGVAAVLRFANRIEDEGPEWPDTDTIGSEGWHYQLRASMAAAIGAIIRETRSDQTGRASGSGRRHTPGG